MNTAGSKAPATSTHHLSGEGVCPSSRTAFCMHNDAPALALSGAVSPLGHPRAPRRHAQGAHQLSPATTLPDKSVPMHPLRLGHAKKFTNQNFQSACSYLHTLPCPFPLSMHLFILKHSLILPRKECEDIFVTAAPCYF